MIFGLIIAILSLLVKVPPERVMEHYNIYTMQEAIAKIEADHITYFQTLNSKTYWGLWISAFVELVIEISVGVFLFKHYKVFKYEAKKEADKELNVKIATVEGFKDEVENLINIGASKWPKPIKRRAKELGIKLGKLNDY